MNNEIWEKYMKLSEDRIMGKEDKYLPRMRARYKYIPKNIDSILFVGCGTGYEIDLFKEEHPEMNLINYQELVAIQVLWHRDNIFNHNVSEIYNKFMEFT